MMLFHKDFTDMLMLLPIISLLIRTIQGSPEIHDSTLLGTEQLGNDNHGIRTANRTGLPSNDTSKMWERNSPREKRSRMEIDSGYAWSGDPKEDNTGDVRVNGDSNEYNRETDYDVKIFPKARETAESRFNYMKSAKNEEFPTLSQEKKNSWLSLWGGKRLSPKDPNISNIRRPIRVPFDSWGGKRGKEYPRSNVDTQLKLAKLTLDRIDRDTSVDGFNDVKRVVKVKKDERKTAFDSWGGKRADKSIGREQFLFSPVDRKVFDVTKGEFVGGENSDEYLGQPKNGFSGTHEYWRGKCNSFPYAILLRVCNETVRDDYTMEEESAINEWRSLLPNKRTEHGQYKKTKFNPWGGKRSSKSYGFGFGNKYFILPGHSVDINN